MQEQSKGKTLEGANDPVTDGDMQSHLEMFHSIKNAFSGVTVSLILDIFYAIVFINILKVLIKLENNFYSGYKFIRTVYMVYFI